jgi:hypothetical protein
MVMIMVFFGGGVYLYDGGGYGCFVVVVGGGGGGGGRRRRRRTYIEISYCLFQYFSSFHHRRKLQLFFCHNGNNWSSNF